MSFNVDAFNSASSIAQKRRASGRQLSDGVCMWVCGCVGVWVCVIQTHKHTNTQTHKQTDTHTHTHTHTHTASRKVSDVQIVDDVLNLARARTYTHTHTHSH